MEHRASVLKLTELATKAETDTSGCKPFTVQGIISFCRHNRGIVPAFSGYYVKLQ
jgi:hypothetical protein